ncbi:GldM family protein [Flavobacterium chungangense]|uniref:GldM family protein n=1 Tax=Flavobacterium chungangense TaxID=554283 RepID=UPI0004DEF9AB|nr:GldM family protein [Flavobacterium chungangense]
MIKKLLLFFFFSFALNSIAQKDSVVVDKPSIAVVSADKLNVVYRGVLNPISIAVPNCKSFTASGSGLNKNKEGKYYLSPGQGLYSIIKIDIILNDNSIISEEHKFRIKQINNPLATINEKSCYQKCILEMTRNELSNATIGFSLPQDLLFDMDFSKYKINSFIVKLPNNVKIFISGNQLNKEVLDKIKKLKKGLIFSITDIGYSFPGSENYLLPRLLPIKIMVVEEEIKENYYESKEFIRDSIRRIKNEKKLLKR